MIQTMIRLVTAIAIVGISLVVLSHDPTLVDPESIRDIVVQRTYVDGELLYSV